MNSANTWTLTLTESNELRMLRCDSNSRAYTEDDENLLRQLIVNDSHTAGEILAIGRSLFDWLHKAAKLVDNPLKTLKIRAPFTSAVWQAPWEIIANNEEHFAKHQLSVLREPIDAQDSGSEENVLDSGQDDFRLGVLFMAASPEGSEPLRFEDEEAAIRQVIHDPEAILKFPESRNSQTPNIDLFCDDTGNLNALSKRLGLLAEQKIDVLHLSGHARTLPSPAFEMEEIDGTLKLVTAEEIAGELGYWLPKIPIIFLSACQTGGADAVESIAETLIKKGANAVLAWGGRVNDVDATAFAAWFYHGISRGYEVSYAVSSARRQLLNSGYRHWHLARLFVGRKVPKKLTLPTCRARPIISLRNMFASEPESNLSSNVRKAENFVGRRRIIKKALKELDSRRGIVLTGVGQQGKSLLAYLLSDRLHDRLTPIVAQDSLDALTLYQRLTKHFSNSRIVNHLGYSDLTNQLNIKLRDWLTQGQKPILLILDGFEKNLDLKSVTPKPLQEKQALVQSILEAFKDSPTYPNGSRLIITSRVPFECYDNIHQPLHDFLSIIQIPEMIPAERSLMRGKDIQSQLRYRAENAGRGNPGVTEALLRLAEEDPNSFITVCNKLDDNELPEGKVGEVLQNTGLKQLIDKFNDNACHGLLLRIGLFLKCPVPGEIFKRISANLGITDPTTEMNTLVKLGILEKNADNKLALNSLASIYLDPISEDERKNLSSLTNEAMSGLDIDTDHDLGTQAFLAAAVSGNLDILKRTADKVVPTLGRLNRSHRMGTIVVEACYKLVEQSHPVNFETIMSSICQGITTANDIMIKRLFDEAKRLRPDDRLLTAFLTYLEGKRLAHLGKKREAKDRFLNSAESYKNLDNASACAVVWNEIAELDQIRNSLRAYDLYSDQNIKTLYGFSGPDEQLNALY